MMNMSMEAGHRSAADNTALLGILFDKSPDSIFICSKDGKVLRANAVATEYLNFDTYKHQSLNVHSPEERLDGESTCLGMVPGFSFEHEEEMERVFSRGDGRLCHVHIRTQPILFGGQDCILVVLQDISRLRKHEDRIRQASKMQSIGQLAGGIAHDFNNALGGIVGYAELAMEDAEGNLIQKENLEKLLLAAERAKKLVRQILTFSRQNTPRKDEVQLAALLEESIAFLRHSIPSTVSIETAIAQEAIAVAGDPARIQEMLYNIVTNSVYAMAEEGLLRISLEKIYTDTPVEGVVGEIAAGEYAVIRVDDNGCGIEPSLVHLIFEPFFSTKHPDEGIGMGLSVVFGVVRSHGGNIRIESKPGEGTSVWVYLPLVRANSISSPAPMRSESGVGTLLVVDDEPVLVDICRKLLTSMGYKVLATMDVNEALDILQDENIQIDALLTDQTMPQMKGAELASRAMKLRPGLPVVLCTGFRRNIDEEAAMKLGISKFIHKPVRKNELARVVKEVMKANGK
ncbi:MAG: response regulator [Deltaproteobacteria bacterium]|nr:response regulator [Deltaproteobacteria bacterium]